MRIDGRWTRPNSFEDREAFTYIEAGRLGRQKKGSCSVALRKRHCYADAERSFVFFRLKDSKVFVKSRYGKFTGEEKYLLKSLLFS